MNNKEVLRFSGILLCGVMLFSGCNRAAMRFHGVGDTFPPAATGYTAKNTHAEKIYLDEAVDKTADYYGISVAGTSWQGTKTDTFGEAQMRQTVMDELRREIAQSALFSGIAPDKNDLVLETEIRAFGAQARGFLFVRIGGVSAFKFTLRQGNRILLEKVYEKVVKDNDKEYTGSSIGMLEDCMRSAMSDSYREVLKALFADLEQVEI